MNMRKIAMAAAVALSSMFAGMSGAFAYEAAATTALNVRSGPGTNFGVVGALQRNQVVEVLECNAANTWCRIQDRTLRGWASARYLQQISGTTSRPGTSQPDVGFSINTPGFSISIGSGGANVRPPFTGTICFFEDFDYRGRSFCVRDGESARNMDRFWDDRIRSARVDGTIEATVCSRSNFQGRCAVIDRSVRSLGALSNDISSYWVGRR